MTPVVTIFTTSGLALLTLILTKSLEKKRGKQLVVLSLISKGDTYIRELYQKILRLYSEGKENYLFLWEKQIPLHSRNWLNKLASFLKERREQYINNMRNTRLLKKSDGMSEFFKSMSNIEKGDGEIHDGFEESSQEVKKTVE